MGSLTLGFSDVERRDAQDGMRVIPLRIQMGKSLLGSFIGSLIGLSSFRLVM